MRKVCVWIVAVFVGGWPLLSQGQADVTYPDEAWKKLDSFEAHVLAKADQTYIKKQYRQAMAEYDSFIVEFPRSKAIPYAILKKGLATQNDGKRFQAVEIYQEVLDYFPNDVDFAAPAIYYIGSCHSQNGDIQKAMKAWAEMAQDADYRKHALAADAINQLAGQLMKQEKSKEAAQYYQQVAVDFRTKSSQAAATAREEVIRYYIRLSPNEPALREFYRQVDGFEGRPGKVSGDMEQDEKYWQTVLNYIWKHGDFKVEEEGLKKQYYGYWAKTLDGKFPAWDGFQIAVAQFRFRADGDKAKWVKRLDDQFKAYQKPENQRRIFTWISAYAGHKEKLQEYCDKLVHAKLTVDEISDLTSILCRNLREQELGKTVFGEYYKTLDFEKITNADILRLVWVVYDWVADAPMARNLIRKLKFDKMQDPDMVSLSRNLWRRDAEMVPEVCVHFSDKELGKMELLRFYHYARNEAKGLPLAEELTGTERFSAEAWWKKAELLEWGKKYKEALEAYKMCDNPPDNLWKMADCLVGMGKIQEAVAQLVEIENFFKELKDHAPRAALQIAHIYNRAGDRARYIGALRGVLKKYPKSAQSSAAHQELEKLGVKMGGGVDAE